VFELRVLPGGMPNIRAYFPASLKYPRQDAAA
jgi:hypothetical protein